MWESPLWGLAGGALGLLASVIVSIVGYFLKRTLEDNDRKREKLETRLTDYLTEVRNELSEVELVALKTQAEMQKKFGELNQIFVPRNELKEIVQGIKDSAQTNVQLTHGLNKKLDDILMILAKKEGS